VHHEPVIDSHPGSHLAVAAAEMHDQTALDAGRIHEDMWCRPRLRARTLTRSKDRRTYGQRQTEKGNGSNPISDPSRRHRMAPQDGMFLTLFVIYRSPERAARPPVFIHCPCGNGRVNSAGLDSIPFNEA
jgi:hypothetical protein